MILYFLIYWECSCLLFYESGLHGEWARSLPPRASKSLLFPALRRVSGGKAPLFIKKPDNYLICTPESRPPRLFQRLCGVNCLSCVLCGSSPLLPPSHICPFGPVTSSSVALWCLSSGQSRRIFPKAGSSSGFTSLPAVPNFLLPKSASPAQKYLCGRASMIFFSRWDFIRFETFPLFERLYARLPLSIPLIRWSFAQDTWVLWPCFARSFGVFLGLFSALKLWAVLRVFLDFLPEFSVFSWRYSHWVPKKLKRLLQVCVLSLQYAFKATFAVVSVPIASFFHKPAFIIPQFPSCVAFSQKLNHQFTQESSFASLSFCFCVWENFYSCSRDFY